MELRQLRYFVEIAAAGSLREASNRLHVAQPALTRHLRSLEGELGVELCARHARGIRLTPAGTRFLDHATAIIRQLNEIRSLVSEDVESPSGIATIGAPGSLGRHLFGGVANSIEKNFSRIALRVVEGGAYTLLAALDSRRVDIAVMVDPDSRTGFTLEPLVTEPVYLVGGRSDERFSAENIEISELQPFPLATFGRASGPQKIFDHAAAKAGVSLNIAYELESLDVIKDFVRRGLAYALLPHSSIFEELKNHKFNVTRLNGIGITRTLIMREDLAGDPVAEVVSEIIRKEINSLISSGVFGQESA
ncbi:MAG: hypothetical protein CMM52_07370 [Rhodospirillaceae bacterium]|nr:hypothetical protein [Rhodospirillaceae bacterium]|tara:strand:+ start:16826 stop:17743 length:918 start_codon:yes stop_codon:yes gene_type:complete